MTGLLQGTSGLASEKAGDMTVAAKRQAEAIVQRAGQRRGRAAKSPEARKRDSVWGLGRGCLEIRRCSWARPRVQRRDKKQEAGDRERDGRGENRQRANGAVVAERKGKRRRAEVVEESVMHTAWRGKPIRDKLERARPLTDAIHVCGRKASHLDTGTASPGGDDDESQSIAVQTGRAIAQTGRPADDRKPVNVDDDGSSPNSPETTTAC